MGLTPQQVGLYDREDESADTLAWGGLVGLLDDEPEWNAQTLEFAKATLKTKGIDVSPQNIHYLKKDQELDNLGYSGLVRKLREDRGENWANLYNEAGTHDYHADKDLGTSLRYLKIESIETIFRAHLESLIAKGVRLAVDYASNDRTLRTAIGLRHTRNWSQWWNNEGYVPVSDDLELADLSAFRDLLRPKEDEVLNSPTYLSAFGEYKDAYEQLVSDLDAGLKHGSDTDDFKKEFPKSCDAVIKARQALNKAWVDMNTIPYDILKTAKDIIKDTLTTQNTTESATNTRRGQAFTKGQIAVNLVSFVAGAVAWNLINYYQRKDHYGNS